MTRILERQKEIEPLASCAAAVSSSFEERLTVFVEDFCVDAQIGVHAHERCQRQRLAISVTVEIEPCPQDRIDQTIDYERIADLISATISVGHIELVETVARHIATGCLAFPGAKGVQVRIEKPGALERGLAGAMLLMRRPSEKHPFHS